MATSYTMFSQRTINCYSEQTNLVNYKWCRIAWINYIHVELYKCNRSIDVSVEINDFIEIWLAQPIWTSFSLIYNHFLASCSLFIILFFAVLVVRGFVSFNCFPTVRVLFILSADHCFVLLLSLVVTFFYKIDQWWRACLQRITFHLSCNDDLNNWCTIIKSSRKRFSIVVKTFRHYDH